MKYRKKPVVVEAIQWNGSNLSEVMEFIGSEFKYESNTSYATSKFSYMNGNLTINTLHGVMEVSNGDYIIKGIKGEFYPCKSDIFQATYELIDSDI